MNQTPIAHSGRNNFNPSRSGRPPGALRQLEEIADKLGVTGGHLRAAFATAFKVDSTVEHPPRPWSAYRREGTRVVYYVEREVIAWYKRTHTKATA